MSNENEYEYVPVSVEELAARHKKATEKLAELSTALKAARAAREAHKKQHAKKRELGLSNNPDDNCCFNHDEEVMGIEAEIAEIEEWLDQEERG